MNLTEIIQIENAAITLHSLSYKEAFTGTLDKRTERLILVAISTIEAVTASLRDDLETLDEKSND